MSYRSRKRRRQRRHAIERVQWWKGFRMAEADRAFEEWKLIHVDQIRKEYLEGSN
jgi:hypothetical protein